MWFLRAWKIGQIESTAAAEGKSPAEVSGMSFEPGQHPIQSLGPRSSVFRRLFAWKRV